MPIQHRLALLITIACLVSPMTWANGSIDDLEQWSVVTLDTKLPKRFRLYAEAQPRLGDNLSSMDRLLVRSALGYQVTKSMSVWQGYAWTPQLQRLNVQTGRFFDATDDEQRIFQQLLFENQWKKLKVVNRTRLEQRMIDNAGGTSVRGRHMLRLAYPLTKSKKWHGVAYNELFINLNDTKRGPQSGFDQNRLFVGVNRQLGKHVSLEVGYLNNPVNVFNQPTNRMNHIILAAININK